MPKFTTTMNENDKRKLEKLCAALDISPHRGKSFVISQLINHAKVEGRTLEMRKFPSQESLELLKEEFANMARVGGNLNQFVHLLQIRRLRLDNGEDEELVVEVDFLVALLKELAEDVEEIKDAIASFVGRY